MATSRDQVLAAFANPPTYFAPTDALRLPLATRVQRYLQWEEFLVSARLGDDCWPLYQEGDRPGELVQYWPATREPLGAHE